ncbi:MAG: type II toxin-antitoxin system prevent-host-death family antitoxin [Chloroflexia bacterium]
MNALAPQTFSSRDFTDNVAAAKRASRDGPVFITDRGKPAHVLLSKAEYRQLTSGSKNLHELLARPGLEDIEFDPPRLQGQLVEPAL